MISYDSPGVYIEEIASGPQPITAAPTSVVAIAGATERGPYQQPTRITGWAEFQAVFGRPVSGGYTAHAMYGFFENGGPAAYVVRCDDSETATWAVHADDETPLFDIKAASPGAWGSRLTPSVVPDLTNGSGRLYAGAVELASSITLPATAGQHAVAVASVQGVASGDTVLVVTPAGQRQATVASVDTVQSKLTLDVLAGPELTLSPKATWVAAQVPKGATALRPASGGGFHRGEALAVLTPSMRRRSVVVGGVTDAATGPLLSLAEPLDPALPAGEFAVRTVRMSARLPKVAVPDARILMLTDLVWDDETVPQDGDLTEGHHAVASDGLPGAWHTGDKRLKFSARVPVGPVEVDVQVAARPFEEKVRLEHPTREELRDAYSFVPNGTDLTLDDDEGTTLTLKRKTGAADGWEPLLPDPADKVWQRVRIGKPADATDGLVVRCVRRPEPGTDFIELEGDTKHAVKSVEKHGNAYLVFVEGSGTVAVGTGLRYPLYRFERTSLTAQRFTLKVSEDGTAAESYGQLALHPDHPRYYLKDGIVNGVSARIAVFPKNPPAMDPAAKPLFVHDVRAGSNRTVAAAGLKRGFTELERVTEPAMVICPDVLCLADEQLQTDVVGAMTRHCEEFRRFAIVDPPHYGDQDPERDRKLAEWRGKVVNSIQAGTYAPHVRMVNLVPEAAERIVTVPPSGFVAGVFARTDRERGVHKAPANERVHGIVGLAQEYTQRRQDLLNPAGVNLIRSFPARGTRVWGARTSTDDAMWRYVNVRRLFNMVETSIERSTNWVVFEPNNQDTWLRIRVSVENFLDQLFRAGALAGTSPEQAYRVRVGLGETMTETDVDLGLVVTQVAIAPVKPAEFVVFRFSHKRLTE
ncbi:phage tail sheath subtilisin-like domain-containing protein [Streptomyces sp. NPDC058326]|uniref:phage tail sheath family protein n=1 Tax=Streptomyces sp. NPDC058326 TaxID=3346447 RepID=UPI0036E4E185